MPIHGRPSTDANLLTITCSSVSIKPFCELIGGSIVTGQRLELSGYDLNQLLAGLLEDYTEEEIIEKIKQL